MQRTRGSYFIDRLGRLRAAVGGWFGRGAAHDVRLASPYGGAARARRFIAETRDVFFETDIDGRITFLNPAWVALTGQRVEDSIGQFVGHHVVPDDMGVVGDIMAGFVGGSDDYVRTVLRFTRADGSERRAEVMCQPIRDRRGAVIGASGMIHDVTARDANAAALAASEARFRTLAEVAPAGIFLCDATGQVSYVNPAWCAMTGLSADAAQGRGWSSALHPDCVPAIAEAFAKHAAGGTIEPGDIGFVHPDGSERWTVSIAAPAGDGSDGFVGVTVDVTAQRSATAALRASEARLADSEARYRSLVESAADALVDIDLDGTCRYVSPAVATVAGLDPDQIVNLSFWRYTHPDDVAVQRALLASLADGRAARGSCQYRSIDTDGGTRWIEATLHGKRGQGGAVTGYIGAIRDVTDIVSVVAELEMLQDTIDETPPTLH